MKTITTLNLVYPKKSDIQFVHSKFPDGQQSIKITSDISKAVAIKIYSRFTNFRDLELIICATAALRNLGMTEIFLYIPYFLGGRSDRKFESGSINYIKDVVSPIINAQGYAGVFVLDPHSDVIEACINRLIKIDNTLFVKSALDKIKDSLSKFTFDTSSNKQICMISPDAGALKKIYSVASECEIVNIVTASKVRDLSTGKILHTEVPLVNINSDPTVFVIVDDICDGGRTFIEVAKAIRTSRPMPEYQDKIFLVISHGIFSNGLYDLSKWVDGVWSTNSFSDIKADDFSDYTVLPNFLTQFNVF
jgi:ribose-phosphate pyrophosphokinase